MSNFRMLFICMVYVLLRSFIPAEGEAWDGVIIGQADYEGLQAFKHALDDPRGVLRSWNGTGLGACSGGWVGIKCVRGQVIAIQLPWRGLGGRISEKIGQLVALRKLSLHDNNIGGQIPPAIGFLPDLKGLYLFNNRFSGTIPPSIGNCKFLQTIDLSNNLLIGTIPSSVANSTRLYRLNISFNSLTGTVPASITSSRTLTYMSLKHNNLSGPIPDTWDLTGDNYQLEILQLDFNSFTGSIPSSLGKLQKLKELSLGNNMLDGSIPNDIGMLHRLVSLDVSYNSISGGLPTSLFNLSSLVKLSVEGNRLDVGIPDAIGELKNLADLSLKRNQFHGEIPATLGKISSLSLVDLSENKFSGEIPDTFGSLSNLTFFNVSNNNLSGPVPLLLLKKFNSSSFKGNIQLCGYSVAVPCPSSPSPSQSPPLSTSRSPPLPPQKKRRHKLSVKNIILIAAGGVIALLLLLCCVVVCLLVRKRGALEKKSTAAAAATRGEKSGVAVTGPEAESAGEAGGKLVHFDGPLAFTADDLLCATAEILGKSTYGTVYKATLEDGNQVAVKRLREKITKPEKEFEAEVNSLGKIRHPNLVPLRAYYLGPKGEKLLVFEYMPKGSLAAFLHARTPDTQIDWPTRMNVAIGVARGLHYLHAELNMVHGNLTSSNVLLDENNNPKIADFGLSRLMTAAASSNVIAAAGALGYRAPEFSKLKKASTKTDVYSLGVVMLELLTGKSPSDTTNGMELPHWVASIVKEEWTNEVFDLELMRAVEGATGDELLNTLKLALHCVDPSPAARPEVQEVLQQLEEIKPELAGAAGTSHGDRSGGATGASGSSE